MVRFNQGQISQSLVFHGEAEQGGHAELTFLFSMTAQLGILSTSVSLVPLLARPDSGTWLLLLDKHCKEMEVSGWLPWEAQDTQHAPWSVYIRGCVLPAQQPVTGPGFSLGHSV